MLVAAAFESFNVGSHLVDSLVLIGAIFSYVYSYMQHSRHDPLTGLYNRETFQQHTCAKKNKIAGVVSIDVNDLKFLNDSNGHAAGDEALAAVGSALLGVRARNISLYRVGGDEFMAVLFNGSRTDVEELERRVRAQLDALPFVCAVGSACRNEAESLDELCQRADTAMYREKDAYYQTQEQALVRAQDGTASGEPALLRQLRRP